MTQEEKLLARLASLDDGLSTIRFFKKNGELVMWFYVDTLKAEGEKRDKIEERKEV
jgi:hypothetical protein